MRPAARAGVRGAARLALLAVLALGIAQPVPVRAADPGATPTPGAVTPRPASCAERYPAEGPGGVDLQLGCLVNELVAYAGGLGPSDQPQRLTAYLVPIAVVVAGLVALVLVARQLNRRARRRIAPAMPVAWWSCPACRSLNPAGRLACYRCNRPFEPGATEMRTDAEPPAPQAFGRRIDPGDHP
jgi:hypothetical protein